MIEFATNLVLDTSNLGHWEKDYISFTFSSLYQMDVWETMRIRTKLHNKVPLVMTTYGAMYPRDQGYK